jgi:hypothetical protein
VAKEYFGINSLRSLIRLIQADLETKVSTSDIIDDLTTNDGKKPLSAAQGKSLNDRLQTIDSDGDGTVDNAAMLGGHDVSYFATAEALQELKESAVNDDLVGEANGVVPLDENGKIDATFLPTQEEITAAAVEEVFYEMDDDEIEDLWNAGSSTNDTTSSGSDSSTDTDGEDGGEEIDPGEYWDGSDSASETTVR